MARDKKILALVVIINDTLRLVNQGQQSKQVQEIELYRNSFKSMALLIRECGYFIICELQCSSEKEDNTEVTWKAYAVSQCNFDQPQSTRLIRAEERHEGVSQRRLIVGNMDNSLSASYSASQWER